MAGSADFLSPELTLVIAKFHQQTTNALLQPMAGALRSSHVTGFHGMIIFFNIKALGSCHGLSSTTPDNTFAPQLAAEEKRFWPEPDGTGALWLQQHYAA